MPTATFHYPLPSSTVIPDRSLRMKDGMYIIKDPTSTSSTKRTRMLKNSQLTRMYADTSGLSEYARKETLHALYANPDLASQLVQAESPAIVDTIAAKLRKESFGSASREFSLALHAWIDLVEYGGDEEVPELFAPYVNAYVNKTRELGWTFDRELSHRWITDAGVTGILPDTPVFSNSHRVYHTRGGLVSLRTTTSAHVEYRMAQYMADAGFAARATEYLLGGKAGAWTALNEQWKTVRFGVGVISRDLDARVEFFQLDRDISLELAQTAYTVYTGVHSKAVAAVIDTPATFVGVSLEHKIRNAQSREELDALWQAHSDEWTDAYTELGMVRIQELEQTSRSS